jgi:signal transduction histidine kinase
MAASASAPPAPRRSFASLARARRLLQVMAGRRPFLRLYLRIWLAVVLAVAVLTLLVGWAWRITADPPPRDAVIRTFDGRTLGTGQYLPRQPHALPLSYPGSIAVPPPPPPAPAPGEVADEDGAPLTGGPEFRVRMQDGQEVYVHLPRPPRTFWNRPPFGFFWTLLLVGVAVALATYPIVRKLTRRLERLQRGVEQWGAGDLSVRVPVQGHDEVAFLADRFNRSAERIETLVESHKSLLANASHELRSPLARIRMGLELMGMGSKPSPAFRDEISRNIAELDQLIDEILLASRLDAREADLGTVESIDLAGLAAEECARVDADLRLPGGAAGIEAPGVAKLLRRAVRNLLENARRHSRPAGDAAPREARDADAPSGITAEVSAAGDRAVVRVSDRGPGVPEALRARIFEPFYRMPGASERDGGVGLGLALVRSIAERHGGSARCEDRPDGERGASFVLELPLRRAPPASGAS